jgi:hypothetical protein
MDAEQQLALFEPKGQELATLASRHAQKAHALALLATAQASRNYLASARVFFAQAADLLAQAEVCELALLFEQLAGLGGAE